MARHHRLSLGWIIAVALSVQMATATSTEYMKWTDVRQIGPFSIQAAFPLAKYDHLFAELPELQREITRTLGVRPAASPIYVYIFADEERYRSYTQRHFPKVPYRSALFVLENGLPGVYTYDKEDLDIDLRHECTHALLHSSLALVPLWLDEGIAKYFEVPADQRAFDHPYFTDPKWKWSLRLGMVRSIESLEERDQLSDMDAADYRYAWAWVHFMMHGPEAAHEALVRNIACYQQGSTPEKLSVELAAVVPNPSEKMIQHFKHWQR
ncbi:MAG TPA: hypothetical protein VH107_06510 [Lacipirellulaceae bacterium]|jgi:hypothetical protein|nr:hypothetical protein [Lacipirellulaceae bacterium]